MPSLPARLQQVKAILAILDEIVAAEEGVYAKGQEETR